jgi:hypothetical protein
MLTPASQVTPATAATLRQRLWALDDERQTALAYGLGANAFYMRSLERDIAATNAAFVGTAVAEIAMLRAELSGRLRG